MHFISTASITRKKDLSPLLITCLSEASCENSVLFHRIFKFNFYLIWFLLHLISISKLVVVYFVRHYLSRPEILNSSRNSENFLICIMVMYTCTVVFCNTLRTNFAAWLLVVPVQVLKLGSWCLCSCCRDQLQREMGTCPPPFFLGCR